MIILENNVARIPVLSHHEPSHGCWCQIICVKLGKKINLARRAIAGGGELPTKVHCSAKTNNLASLRILLNSCGVASSLKV